MNEGNKKALMKGLKVLGLFVFGLCVIASSASAWNLGGGPLGFAGLVNMLGAAYGIRSIVKGGLD